MGEQRRTREVYASLCLRVFPKENLTLMHYILSAWWLQLLERLGKYVIQPGSFEHIMVMNNNIVNLGYTYVKHRLKNPPDILSKIAQVRR